MGSLFGGKGGSKVIPEFTGLQVNTAVQVLPIPIVYGAPRININLIYYNGFIAKKVKTGGKGILTGGKGSSQIEYFATIMLAIGEGTLGDTMIIYQDSGVFVPWDYPTNGASYYNGSPDQGPWPVVQYLWPADARPYPNTAYYGFYNAQLDASATVPQIDLVVQGKFYNTMPLNNSTLIITTGQYDSDGRPLSYIGPIPIGCCDADPALCIWDFLTNPTYGAGFPQEWIDNSSLFSSPNAVIPNVGDNALSTYCQAVGFGWSVVINNAESASSIIERWCKNLNVAPVWTGETLKFIPFWDNYEAGNPGFDSGQGMPLRYYSPIFQVMINITINDILQSDGKDEDPIQVARKDPLEIYNTVRVDYKDRFNFFNDVPAEDQDEAHIELYGPRTDNIGLANEFSHANYAQKSATMQLRRNIGIMSTFTWRMNALWAWLVPMDLVTIPDPANFSNFRTVRIISIEDDDDENVTIVAEEFLPINTTIDMAAGDPVQTFAAGGAMSPAVFSGPSTTPPNQVALNNPPSGGAYPPVVFEPTSAMLTALGYATPQLMLGTSGGSGGQYDPNWGGANIWISLDDVNYTEIGMLEGPSVIGHMTAPLASFSGTNPDMADSVTVTVAECDGVLENYTPEAANAGASICCIQDNNGFEILAYTTATLISPNVYQLTGLYRGLYSTTARAFSAGTQFLYVGAGANVFTNNLPAGFNGQNFYVKLQSFNVFLQSPEDLTELKPYYYLATGGAVVGTIKLVDQFTSTDHWTLAGQYVKTLFEQAATTDHVALTNDFEGVLQNGAVADDVYTH